MTNEQKRQYLVGGAVALAVVIFVFAVFFMLSRTNLVDIIMEPRASEPMGWSYEVISGSEVRAVTPVFEDEYTISFPEEKGRAVRAERILKEKMDFPQLGVYLYDAVCGVDVLLDEELIYTSFEGVRRDEAGLADVIGFAPASRKKVQVYLSEDYIGKKLTVISYFPSDDSDIVPVFPYLCSDETAFSATSVENVPPIALATLCAILAFLTALVYVLDIYNGRADNKILLLTLLYIMVFLNQSFASLAGSYSLLKEKLNALDFICELYIAPLLMFAAFSLTSWRRWILAGATGAWFLADSVKLIIFRIKNGPFYGKSNAPVMFLLFLLALAVIIAELRIKKRRFKKFDLVYLVIAVVAATVRIIAYSAYWDWNIGGYVTELVISPLRGYFYPLVSFISFVCAATVTAGVVIEFVKRTLRTRALMNVLEEQSRQAVEGYRRMKEAERATNAARHEMRHHLLALQGMLKNGDAGGATDYIASLSEELDSLPASRYSQNMMVNVIAGAYLDRAARDGVEVKYSLDLPEKLPVSENDLCVLVTNILENAVKACERMDAAEERFINIKIAIDGNVLFIGCENSRPSDEAEAESGYGMKNMTRVAEKYGGIVKVDQKPSVFAVTAYLNILDK